MTTEPVRVLNLFTIMNRGGAETMVMNYYRNIDRSKVQYDFMVHRQERGAYDDEIDALGGRIYRMPPIRPDCRGVPEDGAGVLRRASRVPGDPFPHVRAWLLRFPGSGKGPVSRCASAMPITVHTGSTSNLPSAGITRP